MHSGNQAMQYFKNSQVVAQIELHDRAFHYGDGCFTTARWFEGHLALEQWHWQRLHACAEALKLQVDWSCIRASFQQFQAEYGTVKILLSRGVGQRGYTLPTQSADVWVFFYPHAATTQLNYQLIKTGVLQQQIGLSMPSLVGMKSLNRLEQVLLKAEADALGYSEAVVCDIRQQVVEGVSSNCFLFIAGQWISPDLNYNGVHGVMRREILQRMQQMGISCQVRPVKQQELADVNSLFFCNALNVMNIATHLADRLLDSLPCIELFHHLHLDQLSEYVCKEKNYF